MIKDLFFFSIISSLISLGILAVFVDSFTFSLLDFGFIVAIPPIWIALGYKPHTEEYKAMLKEKPKDFHICPFDRNLIYGKIYVAVAATVVPFLT